MPDRRELYVTMPDGSIWAVPVQTILDSARRYYEANRTQDGCDVLMANMEDEDDLIVDWAEADMNWSEVSTIARQVSAPTLPDYQEGWMSGDKEINEVPMVERRVPRTRQRSACAAKPSSRVPTDA